MENYKNIFGVSRFFSRIEEYHSISTSELINLLNIYQNNAYIKVRICNELANRNFFVPIFEELAKAENQKIEALFGLSVAQMLGFFIVDNGDKTIIQKLISEVEKWEKHQKEDFIYLLEKNGIYIF